MQKAIKIHKEDNVAVALQSLTAGEEIDLGTQKLVLTEAIPAGHKFALEDLVSGQDVIKYGYPIGRTKASILKGAWIHTHNLMTRLGDLLDYQYEPFHQATASEAVVKEGEKKDSYDYFQGYRREDNSVGIRNEIWIIPTVGCVNDVARQLEKLGRSILTEEVEDIIAFTHPYGCSQLGDDHSDTQRILANLVNHPNAAGVLALGLGCENNRIEDMKKVIGDYSSSRVKFLVCQDYEDEIKEGLSLIEQLIKYASRFHRESIPVSELIVGLKCGGSDGLSGITANPTVGAFSDMLIAKGGTTILTEVPEMFGAETVLMNRCVNQELFQKTVALINDFKQYFIDNQQPVYENPSPGNKDGGITTLEDKSLGCTQKSGKAPVSGVLNYGERVTSNGLMLLSAPGNDLVASTALAASGAHIILFTTGRGTPFGAPVPTIKIASNSALANKKKGWIDFDAGRLVTGTSMKDLSVELYRFVVQIASGHKTKGEENGYRDLAIFKRGVTL